VCVNIEFSVQDFGVGGSGLGIGALRFRIIVCGVLTLNPNSQPLTPYP